MFVFTQGRRGAALVTIFLLVQVTLLWLSNDTYHQISIFCTGPASSRLSTLFGLVHLAFLALLLLGLLSLRFSRIRLAYVALAAAALMMLPVQAALVSNKVLTCDGL